jgi:IS30 family transposase
MWKKLIRLITPRSKKLNPTERRRILALARKGWSVRRIARAVGRGKTTIHRVIQEAEKRHG